MIVDVKNQREDQGTHIFGVQIYIYVYFLIFFRKRKDGSNVSDIIKQRQKFAPDLSKCGQA